MEAAQRYRVAWARTAAERVRDLRLEPLEGTAPGWTAGAHVRLMLPQGGDRPYSLVNLDPAPGATAAPDHLRLGVLLEHDSRGGSAFVHGLAPGDTVLVGPPRNDFALRPAAAPPLLIAGGIGITPVASMAAELAAAGRPFDLHYFGRSRGAMAFLPELAALCGPRLHVAADDAEGPPDPARLLAGVDRGRDIYVCGPKGMIAAVREAAAALGFDPARVFAELFAPEGPQAGDTAFEVQLASDGRVFTVPPGVSILEVLEAAGVDVMSDCRRGDCGICQTGVVAGLPDHRDVVLSPAERAAGRVMQICVSRARSPRLVLDL